MFSGLFHASFTWSGPQRVQSLLQWGIVSSTDHNMVGVLYHFTWLYYNHVKWYKTPIFIIRRKRDRSVILEEFMIVLPMMIIIIVIGNHSDELNIKCFPKSNM